MCVGHVHGVWALINNCQVYVNGNTAFAQGHTLCHPQMQVKVPSCKEEAMCEHDPEMPLSSLGQSSFKMDLK